MLGFSYIRLTTKDGNPYTYNGEYTDAATGDQYLRARYYDPRTGNFLTEDSCHGSRMEPLSQNLYTYAENNPVNYDDPSGHGIFSWARRAYRSVKRTVSRAYTAVRRTVSRAYTAVRRTVTRAYSAVKRTVSNVYHQAVSTGRRVAGTVYSTASRTYYSARSAVSQGVRSAGQWVRGTAGYVGQSIVQKATSAWDRAVEMGQSTYNWGKSKLKEAGNIVNSWTKSMENTVKKFCTTAKKVKKAAVDFVKGIDWKSIAKKSESKSAGNKESASSSNETKATKSDVLAVNSLPLLIPIGAAAGETAAGGGLAASIGSAAAAAAPVVLAAAGLLAVGYVAYELVSSDGEIDMPDTPELKEKVAQAEKNSVPQDSDEGTSGFGDEKAESNNFPDNPDDFNPEGLEKRTYKDGEIIKWHDPDTGKAVYEWNKDVQYGDHYHYTPDGNTRVPDNSGNTHLQPGEPVP